MSSRCDICGKSRAVGHRISKSDNRVKRVWLPNIQRIRINLDGTTVRKNVCTTCIRSGRITRAI
ncbi:MAG TPA: 50S ribosomal protein L28 [Firmicutes bacterium]|jgi:large subunit ribosomal protein L28|nr:50S ribosomal protein L28 [Bacillota bacterium]